MKWMWLVFVVLLVFGNSFIIPISSEPVGGVVMEKVNTSSVRRGNQLVCKLFKNDRNVLVHCSEVFWLENKIGMGVGIKESKTVWGMTTDYRAIED